MPRKLIPDYRRFSPTGAACVKLSGKVFYLGKHGSPRSRERYSWLVGEWIKLGRSRPPVPPPGFFDDDHPDAPAGPVFTPLARVAASFVRHLRKSRPIGPGRIKDHWNILSAMRLIRDELRHANALDLTVVHLEKVQQAMAGKGWSLNTVRDRMRYVRMALKHGAKYRLIPDAILTEIAKMDRLTKQTPGVKKPRKVLPVSDEAIESTIPHLPKTIAALVRVTLLTGARPGEICQLRPCDIETSDYIWRFRPQHHKTERHGKDRVIVIGPEAQKIIEPYLAGCRMHDFIFSPARSEAQRRAEMALKRKTPLKYGNRPGSNRKAEPKVRLGEKYTTNRFRIAISRACERAGIPAWHPNQLRHAAATRFRKEAGLEVASLALGHSSPTITDAVYAERDLGKVESVLAKIG